MNIIHITTDGMDAHTYQYELIKDGGAIQTPSPSYDNLEKLEQQSVDSLARALDTRPHDSDDYEKDVWWHESAHFTRLALEKYHFAKDQGLLDAARKHLYPKGMKYSLGNRVLKGVHTALDELEARTWDNERSFPKRGSRGTGTRPASRWLTHRSSATAWRWAGRARRALR